MKAIAASAYLCVYIPNHYPVPGPGDIPHLLLPQRLFGKIQCSGSAVTASIDEVAAFDLILGESLGDGQNPRIQVQPDCIIFTAPKRCPQKMQQPLSVNVPAIDDLAVLHYLLCSCIAVATILRRKR